MLCLCAASFCVADAASPVGADQSAELTLLELDAPVLLPDQITNGSRDADFVPLHGNGPSSHALFWLKIPPPEAGFPMDGLPVVVVQANRLSRLALFAAGKQVPLCASLAAFRGNQARIFAIPSALSAGQPLYLRVDANGSDAGGMRLSVASLQSALARGAVHARMIALTVGALMAMSVGALLIWFIMTDRQFILYASFFFLQALYIAFLSGEGFDWPLLGAARPLGSFAWNVPVGLGGAVGCLLAREIYDLKLVSPHAYRAFGWFAIAFLILTVANLAKLYGFAPLVSAAGNLVFFVVSVFTLVTSFLSWRRGNRAAGLFLIAWGLLNGFTIAAAVRFLITHSDESEALHYYGLPLSMAAAAVLMALGVADRLRQQRAALTDAERRAQTDPLTGVLNRRSLIERLDAACLRARARGLSISVLFLDLDHFKLINDSFGHRAGDACLRAIIGPIQSELRQSDVIGRYGGEEFVITLSGAAAETAVPIAQRILERVASIRVEGFGEALSLTCSIGVAASDTLGLWGEQLINAADSAVYEAKRAGRNQVKVMGATIPTDGVCVP